MSDTWSALVIGPDAGLLGAPGHDWSSHPDYYERVKVVRADLVDAAIARLLRERDEARTMLRRCRPLVEEEIIRRVRNFEPIEELLRGVYVALAGGKDEQ